MIKKKLIINNFNKDNFYIFIGLGILAILNFSNTFSIRVKTSIFIILLTLFIYIYRKREKDLNLSFSFNNFFILIGGFILLIVTQNTYLNYETISIDVPSYLVASQDIGFSELPYEKQWESKGPLFMYMYKALSVLSIKNLVIFKLLNDFILFGISILIYKISLIKSQNTLTSIFSSVFFISITSHAWYVTELSEIYCLLFITYQYYLITKYGLNKKTILLSSFLISLSSLVNQASVIFLIGLAFLVFFDKELRNKLNNYLYLGIGFLTPHIFFIVLYSINKLLNVYFTNYIKIPFGYVDSGKFDIYELVVWLRRYFIYNEFLYYSLITIGVLLFLQIISKDYVKNTYFNNNITYLILGFSIYVIAGHNYQHHLFYSIVFISIFTSLFKINKLTVILYLLISISSIQIILGSIGPSFNNLKSINDTLENYPLNQLAKEIDTIFDGEDYDVLAVDHLLLLYYLDKPNTSYIIHPYNNFEEYIVEALVETGLLKTNENSHLSYYIELEPDVIICTPQAIIDGYPTKVGSNFFNCEITDYKKNYYQLDTEKYLNNLNREYYYDPYVEIDVFIKNS